MADKNFFDLLKEKMAELRPKEKHREQDWAALGAQLNLALPQHKPKRRPRAVLPLLLLAALLSTNALWWQANQSSQLALERLESKLDTLHSALAATKSAAPKITVRHDTIVKVVYVQVPKTLEIDEAQSSGNAANISAAAPAQAASPPLSRSASPNAASSADQIKNAATQLDGPNPANTVSTETPLKIANFDRLELPIGGHFQSSAQQIELRPASIRDQVEPQQPETAITKKIAQTLRPRFCKVGASAGWLNAESRQLMHEGGISYNLQAEIGFSRHWSLTADLGAAKMHYKAHSPEAILGSPALPMPPSAGHHYIEMDVTGQRIRQFGLGLRHTFAPLGKSRPFLGISWGGQFLRPFSIQYEIQHEPSGTIEKAVYEVSSTTQLKNLVGINAGFEIPLSNRINFILQGFYQRQWKKTKRAAPDFTGVRAGINLSF